MAMLALMATCPAYAQNGDSSSDGLLPVEVDPRPPLHPQLQVEVAANDTPTISISPSVLTLEESASAALRHFHPPRPSQLRIAVVAIDAITDADEIGEGMPLTNPSDDIVLSAGSATLSAETSQIDITVSALDDEAPEEDETHFVVIRLLPQYQASAQIDMDRGRTEITIPENDRKARARLAKQSLAEGDTTTLTVSLEGGALSAAATLTLSLSDELISFSETENLNTTKIVFTRGESKATIIVKALDNGLADADIRTVLISFDSRGTSINPAPEDITLSIERDEEAVITVEPELSLREGDRGRDVIFTITPPLAQPAIITAMPSG